MAARRLTVLVSAYGTHGDVRPAVALALGLRARGHAVEFAGPANLEAWVRSLGLAFHPYGGDAERILQSRRGRMRDLGWMMRHLRDELVPLQFELLAPVLPAADVIVGGGLQFAAASLAERRGVPYAGATYCPANIPTAELPPVVVPWQRLPRALNRPLWRASMSALDALLRGAIGRARAGLGLPALRDPLRHLVRQGVMFVAADRRLAPPPADFPPSVVCTDAWVLEPPGALDEATETFLAAGPAPLYVGFGSMVTADPGRVTREVVGAAERVGRRLVLGAGWTGLGRRGLPDWCHVVAEAPHHVLFPRVAAVVHHGGAGTTTTAARAGVPQVLVPHLLDQHYWAHRVRTLGIGPRALPMRHLTARRLADRLRGIDAYAAPARRLRDEGAGTSGVADAVRVIEGLA